MSGWTLSNYTIDGANNLTSSGADDGTWMLKYAMFNTGVTKDFRVTVTMNSTTNASMFGFLKDLTYNPKYNGFRMGLYTTGNGQIWWAENLTGSYNLSYSGFTYVVGDRLTVQYTNNTVTYTKTSSSGTVTTLKTVTNITETAYPLYFCAVTNAANTQYNAVTIQQVASVPSSPQNVLADVSNGNNTITVSWTAPALTGGLPITSYTVTPSPSGTPITTADGTVRSVTFTGLSAYTSYTFTVVATNSQGNSLGASSPSVILGTVPAAPTITSGVISGTTLSVGWIPSPSPSVTGYTITADGSGGRQYALSGIAASSNIVVALDDDSITDASGAAIGTWTNRVSGSSVGNFINNASTGYSGTNPTVALGSTGKKIVRFNDTRTTDSLVQQNAFGTSLATYTIMIVGRWTTLPTGANGRIIQNTTSNTIWGWWSNFNTIATGVYQSPETPTRQFFGSESANDKTAMRIYTIKMSGNTFTMSVGGVNYTYIQSANTPISRISLGGSAGQYNEPSKCEVAALYIWSRAISEVERLSYESQLATKYGILPVVWNNYAADTDSNVSVTKTVGSGVTSTTLTLPSSSLTSLSTKLYATNIIGNSSLSTVTLTTTPYSALYPTAPIGVTATAGASSITVSWSAPAASGQTPITSYTVTPLPSGTPITTTTRSATFTNLLLYTPYTFSVVATNSNGTGTAATSGSAIIGSLPSAPTNIVGRPANGAIDVSWNAPVNQGYGVASYTITASAVGYPTRTQTVAASPTRGTVSGLTNGVPYSISVVANLIGGTTSPTGQASGTVTPVGVAPPSTPTITSAALNGPTATVVWNTVSGATSYTVSLIGTNSTVTATTTNTTYTFSNVDNTKTYTTSVAATGAGGDSLAATATVVTPWNVLTDPALIFYVPFDNDTSTSTTLTDLSPNALHFTKNLGTITTIGGRTCYAVPQSGTPSMGAKRLTTVTSVSNITYTCWVYLTANAIQYDPLIFSRSFDATDPTTAATGIHLNGTNVGCHWLDTYYNDSTTMSLTLNTWQHVAVVFTPTQSRWYLNGVLTYTRNTTYNTVANIGNFTLGWDMNLGRSMPGYLDDCAVFKRALTVAEITQLYQSGVNIVSNSLVPPTSVVGTAGNGQATVSFTPSSQPVGKTVTSYKVTATPGGATVTGVASPLTVTGLTNGTSYTFVVQAADASGNLSTPSTPSASVVPFPPTISSAVSVGSSGIAAYIAAQPVSTVSQKVNLITDVRASLKTAYASDNIAAAAAKQAYIDQMRTTLGASAVTIPVDNFQTFIGTMKAIQANLTPKPVDVIYPTFVANTATVDISTVTSSSYKHIEVPVGSTVILQNGNSFVNLYYTGTSYTSGGNTYNAGDNIVVGSKTYTIFAIGSLGIGDGGGTGGGGTGGGSGQAICFLGNAPVLTPSGYKRIDSLVAGDLVRTADGRDVAIQRVKHQRVIAPSSSVNPFVILKGQFGATENLAISPRHCVAVPGRGMVEARELGLRQLSMRAAFDYYNLELPEWDNMVVAGVEVESLAPKKRVVITAAQFRELVGRHSLTAAQLSNIARTLADGSVELTLSRKTRRV